MSARNPLLWIALLFFMTSACGDSSSPEALSTPPHPPDTNGVSPPRDFQPPQPTAPAVSDAEKTELQGKWQRIDSTAHGTRAQNDFLTFDLEHGTVRHEFTQGTCRFRVEGRDLKFSRNEEQSTLRKLPYLLSFTTLEARLVESQTENMECFSLLLDDSLPKKGTIVKMRAGLDENRQLCITHGSSQDVQIYRHP